MERSPVKLLDRAGYRIRLKGYSSRTEQSYISLIRRFILYHNKRHPQDMGKMRLRLTLTYLAVNQHDSASTQNQAFNALLFLYRNLSNTSPAATAAITPTAAMAGHLGHGFDHFSVFGIGNFSYFDI